MIEDRPGLVVFRAAGKGAKALFENEAGGHRWQRIPETERKGRVHSSSVTVAILAEPTEQEFRLNMDDVEIRTTRGSGPGGQNRNKVESCVVATHKPSGLTVRAETERSQHQNRSLALGLLRARLAEQARNARQSAENSARRSQIGSGERGDKRRTVAVQRDQVVDHVTGKRISFEKFSRGYLEDLQ